MAKDQTPPPVRGSRANGYSIYDRDTSDSLNADQGYVGAKNFLEQALLDMRIATWEPGVKFGRSVGEPHASSESH